MDILYTAGSEKALAQANSDSIGVGSSTLISTFVLMLLPRLAKLGQDGYQISDNNPLAWQSGTVDWLLTALTETPDRSDMGTRLDLVKKKQFGRQGFWLGRV